MWEFSILSALTLYLRRMSSEQEENIINFLFSRKYNFILTYLKNTNLFNYVCLNTIDGRKKFQN